MVAAFKPTFVAAGHKKLEHGNDPKIIGESQQYLRDFSRIVDEETTAAGIVTGMLEIYPDWGSLRTPWVRPGIAVPCDVSGHPRAVHPVSTDVPALARSG